MKRNQTLFFKKADKKEIEQLYYAVQDAMQDAIDADHAGKICVHITVEVDKFIPLTRKVYTIPGKDTIIFDFYRDEYVILRDGSKRRDFYLTTNEKIMFFEFLEYGIPLEKHYYTQRNFSKRYSAKFLQQVNAYVHETAD